MSLTLRAPVDSKSYLHLCLGYILIRGVARGAFGRSVNPIQTMGGADYARHTTASPPRFKELSTHV